MRNTFLRNVRRVFQLVKVVENTLGESGKVGIIPTRIAQAEVQVVGGGAGKGGGIGMIE